MTNVLHLAGHLAPVPDEISATDLPVEGAIPPELTGRYLRNGPNPLPGETSAHWFTGHGMLHGVRLRGGRAEWYRNRWVRTKALDGQPMITDRGIDLTVGVANTHVVAHAGRIMALVESSLPHLVTPDLDTLGTCDFDGRLTTAMTAHPKTDPVTGELHFFGYGVLPPFLTYHRCPARRWCTTSPSPTGTRCSSTSRWCSRSTAWSRGCPSPGTAPTAPASA
jgi:carotenoid cleavage dioxygenase